MRGRARVIAINDCHRLAPWADVLYAADARWWRYYEGVPAFTGLKYSVQPESAHWPGVRVLKNTGVEGFDARPWALRTGKNSGYQAIHLAVHYGATRILLLGYDMQATSHAKSHWFGAHPDRLAAYSPYADFLHYFESLVAPLVARGVEVINCSRETALRVFPRRRLEDTLP